MIQLHQWAIRHGITRAALQDLTNVLTYGETVAQAGKHSLTTEGGASNDVRLEWSENGGRLMRNNVGMLKNERGVPVRYGLMNDSKQVNQKCKSSDLIGITPILITPEMVGCTIGQFTAREIKKPGWVFTGSERETAQLAFMNLINALGGNACFATGRGTY